MSSHQRNPWSELDMEDPMLVQEFQGGFFTDYSLDDISALMDSLSDGSDTNSSNAVNEISNNNAILQKPNNDYPQSSPEVANSPAPQECDQPAPDPSVKVLKKRRREPDQCQHHIMAERQRRQTLSQLFIAMSALIPGLTKIDKTSVLGEAITYMKQLKERVKILEEERSQKAVETAVVVQTSRIVLDNDDNNSSTTSDNSDGALSRDEQFPEIEARFSDKCVLIKIHCHIQPRRLSKIINEIEKLNLLVINATSMSFNNATLDITIMAQMGKAFDERPQEVLSKLRAIF